MKKKLIGKIGALLMAVTMAFSGTTVAFADETTDNQESDQQEAVVERPNPQNLVNASSNIIEEGDGYTVYKGTPLDNGGYTAWIYLDEEDLNKDVNSTVSDFLSKDYVVDESYIAIGYEGSDVTVTKSNLQKMKDKKMMLSVYKYSDEEDLDYTIGKVTNADSDFSVKTSFNTDTVAINKIKNAGITKYYTLTTNGKAGTALPGNGSIYTWLNGNPANFDYTKVSDEEWYTEKTNYDLFVYYYNASTGRFVGYINDAKNEEYDSNSQCNVYTYSYQDKSALPYSYSHTSISLWECDYNGTYVVTQGALPASLLMDTYTGLSHEGNDWLYYKNGKVDNKYTGLCKYNGSWWYVKNGKVDFSATTLCKYNGSWWYVRGGKVDFASTTLCKYNGSWWYVSGGKVHFGATGLCKYNGSWWYVKNGKVDFSATTLCKFNGNWFYVKGGKVSFTTTLCKYNGTWFYVNNGVVNFSKTTLVKYNGSWFAVAGGKVAWGYTGKMNYNGGTFRVVNGIVRF